jgi:hypothetical protein
MRVPKRRAGSSTGGRRNAPQEAAGSGGPLVADTPMGPVEVGTVSFGGALCGLRADPPASRNPSRRSRVAMPDLPQRHSMSAAGQLTALAAQAERRRSFCPRASMFPTEHWESQTM